MSVEDIEKARIENNQIDGCGYTIRLNNGDQIEPVNLADFDIQPKHNQKVWVPLLPDHSFLEKFPKEWCSR